MVGRRQNVLAHSSGLHPLLLRTPSFSELSNVKEPPKPVISYTRHSSPELWPGRLASSAACPQSWIPHTGRKWAALTLTCSVPLIGLHGLFSLWFHSLPFSVNGSKMKTIPWTHLSCRVGFGARELTFRPVTLSEPNSGQEEGVRLHSPRSTRGRHPAHRKPSRSQTHKAGLPGT